MHCFVAAYRSCSRPVTPLQTFRSDSSALPSARNRRTLPTLRRRLPPRSGSEFRSRSGCNPRLLAARHDARAAIEAAQPIADGGKADVELDARSPSRQRTEPSGIRDEIAWLLLTPWQVH